jgi:hypothetical protein
MTFPANPIRSSIMTASEPSLSLLQSPQDGDFRSLAAQWDALVENEGGGSWPPRPARPQASSSSSPSGSTCAAIDSANCLTSSCSWWQAYHDLALSLAASGRFVDSRDGLHPTRAESELRIRIDLNRQWLAEELERVVILDTVMQRLRESLAPEDNPVSSSSCLGFLACLAYLAHLYRWGTIPVVSLAQDERMLKMPEAISRPLRVLRERYGLKTSGGCK